MRVFVRVSVERQRDVFAYSPWGNRRVFDLSFMYSLPETKVRFASCVMAELGAPRKATCIPEMVYCLADACAVVIGCSLPRLFLLSYHLTIVLQHHAQLSHVEHSTDTLESIYRKEQTGSSNLVTFLRCIRN